MTRDCFLVHPNKIEMGELHQQDLYSFLYHNISHRTSYSTDDFAQWETAGNEVYPTSEV